MLLSDSDLLFHISLSRITFLKFEEKKILAKNIDSADNLGLSSIEDIEQIIGRKISKKAIWNGKENLHCAQMALHYCKTFKIDILVHEDERYPELLRQIADPPYLLYCRGNVSLLTDSRSVSVVGTRKLSQAGKAAARQFAYDACVNGCNVVSGLANGADGFAHQGAVDAYFDYSERGLDTLKLGKTIAVLPSSIDEIVPASHKKLASQILESGGLIVSEYEPKMPIVNWHFVGRNRIIAGMSPATVVVEAPAGSGALITADFALENNRDVMFHEATFGNLAKQVAEMVGNQLEVEHAAGLVSRYKLENRPEKFLEAGAPVIKDYKDYCKCLAEMPGMRSAAPVQGTLFD